MALRFAFMGFRHGHILEAYELARKTPGCLVVAACEEDEPTRRALAGKVDFTHSRYERMLDEAPCDVVGMGEYYARRGAVAAEALRRGKHVLSDKPLCTSLGELDAIEALAREKRLAVGCQLSLPCHPNFVRLREVIAAGRIGTVHQVAFGGQHPLNYGSRPGWYFEPGKHGGTINDIAIHAFDLLPRLTGLAFAKLVAARTWNAFATEVPHFMDAAQMLLVLANGAGVLGDVSYAMPSKSGYRLPQYWRVTVFGSRGLAETSVTSDHVALAEDAGSGELQRLQPAPAGGAGYFESFVAEATGAGGRPALTTAEVLAAARVALKVQDAADRGARDVTL